MQQKQIKIVFIADLYGSFRALRTLMEEVKADLYLISGELLCCPFFSNRLGRLKARLQLRLDRLKADDNLSTYEFAQKILSVEIAIVSNWMTRKIANAYIELAALSRRRAIKKYNLLANYLQKYSNAPTYVIPGERDSQMEFSHLNSFNIHSKNINFRSYKLLGLNEYAVFQTNVADYPMPKFRPPTESEHDQNVRAAFHFINSGKPNIVILNDPLLTEGDIQHEQNKNGHDHNDRNGNSAVLNHKPDKQPAIAKFLSHQDRLSLILSGSHERFDSGFIYQTKNTFIVNGGQFGCPRLINPQGCQQGYYTEIIMDQDIEDNGAKGCIRRIKQYQIHQDQINFIRVCVNKPPLSNFGKIGLYEEIKSFFRIFETPFARARVRDLMQISRQIKSNSHNFVAFDLLGSVNFGMSSERSDVDLVMYHRCPREWKCNHGECTKFKLYQNLLLHSLLSKVSNSEYQLDILDCINLHFVTDAVHENRSDDESLIKYIFYRKIGRPVCRQVLYKTDKLIDSRPALKREIESSLDDLMEFISDSSTNRYSFNKYKMRLGEIGIHLPPILQEKILHYSGRANNQPVESA